MFDVGNVIIDADHVIAFKILEGFGVKPENAKLFLSNSEYLEFSRGRINEQEFYNLLVEKYLKVPLTYDQVVYAHNQHIYALNKGVKKVLDSLSRPALAFATDTNPWQTTRERELIDLRKYTDKIFRSHEINMLKIDKGLFPYIIKNLRAEPSEILLIDNSIENIEAGRSCGLLTLQFKTVKQLKSRLRRLKF